MTQEFPELGPPRQAFNDAKHEVKWALWFAVFVAALLSCFVFPITLTAWLFHWPWRGSLGEAGSTLFILVLLCKPALSWLAMLRQTDQLLVICSNGLVYSHPGPPRVIRWDEIESVQSMGHEEPFVVHGCFPPPCRDIFLIKCLDKSELRLNNYLLDYTVAANEIADRSRPYIWERAVGAYRRGEPLLFGRFEVNALSLRYKHRELSWDRIGGVLIGEGKMRVEKKGFALNTWCEEPLKRIPDLRVFLDIVTMIRQETSDR
jgi:hypothetical protein